MIRTFNMMVQTDEDFGIELWGKLYFGYRIDFSSITLDDVLHMNAVVCCGKCKDDELKQAIERILRNPDEEFDTTGGNRGVWWRVCNAA